MQAAVNRKTFAGHFDGTLRAAQLNGKDRLFERPIFNFSVELSQ
jgi:hypothetical protein